MNQFEKMLTGGHPNSLGRTIEVVELVLDKPKKLETLYACYKSEDEVVRLRTSNAMKRIQMAAPSLMTPYLDRFIDEVAKINQASAQWTIAQLFKRMAVDMTKALRRKATTILKRNLSNHEDWIVLNMTMDTLSDWATIDAKLSEWMQPHISRLAEDTRKSVSKKAKTVRDKLYG